MAGLKRKSISAAQPEPKTTSKKIKVEKAPAKRAAKSDLSVRSAKPSKKSKKDEEPEDLVESDTSEDDNGFYGFSAKEEESASSSAEDAEEDSVDNEAEVTTLPKAKAGAKSKDEKSSGKPKDKLDQNERTTYPPKGSDLHQLDTRTSKEAHAKQKALAKERKAAKPNSDIIEQCKQIWEMLRVKLNLTKEERKQLVDELFEIITGRVKDLVFKHDSVRVIQSAVKYSNSEQRRTIAKELKGEFKNLAEGKYSKFLIAKLLEKGDQETRDLIITEFYGHVKRLINHPEAAWILDDSYRAVATPQQKARLLREWYGPEFSIRGLQTKENVTADLAAILKESPEKRKPILDHLEVMINQIIQKKMTGFTMLHDAMLQYFLVCASGSTEANAFLDHLKPDPTLKEGQEADNVDLLKNLAFTKSGSRLMSLAFAYGTAKDRKLFLRPYKDTIELMAKDKNAHLVLLAALAVIDDWKLSSKTIFGELLPTGNELAAKVLELADDLHARRVLLYPYAGDAKWLMDAETLQRLSEVYDIRAKTSKKDPQTRALEVVKAVESQLVSAVAEKTADFAASFKGLQLLGEVLIAAPEIEREKRQQTLTTIAELARDAFASGEESDVKDLNYFSRTLRTLVQGGKYDAVEKKVVPVEPRLGFADIFWEHIKGDVTKWAIGPGSFVIVSLVETEDFEKQKDVLQALKKHKAALEAAASPAEPEEPKKSGKKKGKAEPEKKGNAGTRILLQKL